MRLILKILARAPGGRPDPVRLDLYHPFVLHRHGSGAGRFDGGAFRGGCACDLLPAKRHHPAGDCLSYPCSDWPGTARRGLAAGKGPGLTICDPGSRL